MDTETTKNITDRSVFDYFLCQKCGIHLADYVRIITRAGVPEVWAYKMKYCPECGRKIENA